MLFSLEFYAFFTPNLLRFPACVAVLSVLLVMGFVGQGKFACAIKVGLNNFRENYSSLRCSRSKIVMLLSVKICYT